MSGGSLDYAYCHLDTSAVDIKRLIDKDSYLHEVLKEEATPVQRDKILWEMKSLKKDLERDSKRLKALEWFISGDTGVESYLKEIKT